MFPIIGAIIATAIEAVTKIIAIVGPELIKFANIISVILRGLDILSPEKEIRDLGDQAIQAEEQGIKAENYDSYGEYLNAVKNFEIDKEKSALIDDNKKVEKGIEIVTINLVEKYGEVILDLFMMIAKNPQYFEKRVPYFTELQKEDPNTFSDITRYIEGKETDMDRADETLSKMYDVEKKIDEDASLQKMMDEIEKLKD